MAWCSQSEWDSIQKAPHLKCGRVSSSCSCRTEDTKHTFGIWEALWKEKKKKPCLVVMGFPVTSAACLWGQAHLFCLPFMRRSEVLIQATWWDALQVRCVCLLLLLGLRYNLRAVLTQHPAQAIPWVCDRQIIYNRPMTVDLFYDTSKTDKAVSFVICTVHTISVLCRVDKNCLLILDIKSKYCCNLHAAMTNPGTCATATRWLWETVHFGYFQFFTTARTHLSILRSLYQNSSHNSSLCGLNL